MVKKYLIVSFLLILSVVLFFSFKNQKKEELVEIIKTEKEENKIEALKDGSYNLLTYESNFIWQASKKNILDHKIKGSLDFLESYFIFENKNIVEGVFEIDMTSLEVLKMQELGSKNDLKDHLKSKDFFDVYNYPTARLEIIESNINDFDDAGLLYDVLAKLTIKDIEQEISFSAMVYSLNEKAKVQANFNLDRRLWDINYGSSSFFDLLADEIIDDYFKVSIDLLFE